MDEASGALSVCRWVILLSFPAIVAQAHLNSPHIFVEENVGPYPAMVIIHMPPAVPGVADVQVRLLDRQGNDPVEVWICEIPPQGEELSPGWNRISASPEDANFFSRPVSLMVLGAWQVEIRVRGKRGEGRIKVPVSARVAAPKAMRPAYGVILAGLIGLLFLSGFDLLQGLVRDAHRSADVVASASDRKRGRWVATLASMAFTGYLGVLAFYWFLTHTNARFRSLPSLLGELSVTNPPASEPELSLVFSIKDSEGHIIQNLRPDHGKMMHMVVMDIPNARHFFHLHPAMNGPGRFEFRFSPPSPGRYKIFGDVVRSTGEGETATASLDLSLSSAGPPFPLDDPDDSYSQQQPSIGKKQNSACPVSDGLTMHWKRASTAPLRKGQFEKLTFRLMRSDGQPAHVEPYMGMDGHLFIVRADAEMFAHVHPMGTLSSRPMPRMNPRMHQHMSEVSFPYGFPDRGLHRMWVQMKHQGRIYTGVFDTFVE